MHKGWRAGWDCRPESRWLLTRGTALALTMELAALLLATASGGLRPGTVFLWECIGYLRDSGLVTLAAAGMGGLLLEDLLRRRGG